MAFGFRPISHRNGAPYNGAANRYFINSGLNQALFVGDPVIMNSSGNTAGTLADITIATAAANNEMLGVIVGFEPTRNDLTVKHSAALTEGIALVADDPDLVFEVMEDSVGGSIAITEISQLGISVAGSGNTTDGLSGWQLDSSDFTAGSTSNGQFQLLGIKDDPGNALGTNAIWRVAINPAQHYFGTGQ